MKHRLTIFASMLVILLCSYQRVLAQWVDTKGPTTNRVTCLATVDGGNLIAGTFGDIFITTDGGGTWISLKSNLTNAQVEAILVSGSTIFIGTNNLGVQRATNGGNWTAVNNGVTNLSIFSLAQKGTSIYAGSDGSIYKTTNNGTDWTQLNFTSQSIVFALAVVGQNILAGTGLGVYYSTDDGATWKLTTTGLPPASPGVLAITVVSGVPVAGTRDGTYYSQDGGLTWGAGNPGNAGQTITSIIASGTKMWAGSMASGVFYSDVFNGNSNFGGTWKNVSPGSTPRQVNAVAVAGQNVFAGTAANGVWRRPISEFTNAVANDGSSTLEHIQLSPNPTSGILNVYHAGEGTNRVSVVNMIGENVMQFAPQRGTSFTLDLSQLSAGCYFLRIESASRISTRMIIHD